MPKRNPPDLTLRNARASKRRDDDLVSKVKALAKRVDKIEQLLRIRWSLEAQP